MGLGMSELILIAVVALVVIGPKKLPDIAKSLGKGYGEFRRSFGDLKQSVNLDDLSRPSSNTSSSTQRSEDRKEEIIDTYRSQWEQKLALPEEKVSKVDVPITTEEVKHTAEPKKEDGEASGR